MAHTPLIGQTISHYRIHAKLGEGGMGAVYQAQDLTLGREVALKFLSQQLTADAQARARLLKEAQAASRLSHQNIATIYEVNATDATPFIAMELVQGGTLKYAIEQGTLTRAQLSSVAAQIADGLSEAHRRGVYHRDVKPGNIMLDENARVKILDFGLSELARGERQPSETEETFVTRTTAQPAASGTIPYMSPEQIRGEPADAGSDVFSFGIVLYECLSGRLPFHGETAIDILHAILRSPYPPLRRLVPDVDPQWEALIERCLAKAPAQRCTMAEVIAALQRMAAPPARPENSIAVLYFANLSGSRDDEYFRDGMTEDIITELTKIHTLRLLPRSAVQPFRERPMPVSQIGRELAVAYVLDGSLRRSGDRLRITAQLAETRTGHSVWAERYDRQIEDVFAIQDDIAQSIAGALRVMLSETEKRAIERVPTRDVQAYDYYLRGRRVFYDLRRKSLEFARQMFARAIVIDPGYAAAYAGVANCSCFLYMYFEATEDNLKEAASASRRAVTLDSESADAYAARGLAESLRKQYEAAEKDFEQAIRLNPNLYDAFYFYGRSLFAQGKKEKAAEHFRRAGELDPADYQSQNHLEMCLRDLGRTEEAEQARDAAIARAERHVQMHPNDPRALYLGAGAYWQAGNAEACRAWLARALAIAPEDSGTLYNVACTHALMGEVDRALELLEQAVHHGFGHKEWLDNDPDLVSLREQPRFVALLDRMAGATAPQGM